MRPDVAPKIDVDMVMLLPNATFQKPSLPLPSPIVTNSLAVPVALPEPVMVRATFVKSSDPKLE